MARTDGIATHLLQNLHLANERSLVDSSAKRTQVVVQADTLQLAGLAVQFESALAADAYGADARGRRLGINEHVMFRRTGLAYFVDFSLQLIQIRCLWRPQLRILNRKLRIELAIRFYAHVATRGMQAVGACQHHRAHHALLRSYHLCFSLNDGLFLGDGHRAHVDRPVVNVGLGRQHQLHRPIQTATRIPSRTFLNILQIDGNQILSFNYIRCDVDAESIVAVGPTSCHLTIDADQWLAHSTVKHQFSMAGQFVEHNSRAIMALANPGQSA